MGPAGEWSDEKNRCLGVLDRTLNEASDLQMKQSEQMATYFNSVGFMVDDVLGKGSPWLEKLKEINWSCGVFSIHHSLGMDDGEFLECRRKFLGVVKALKEEFELAETWPRKIFVPARGYKIVLIQGSDKILAREIKALLARVDLKAVLVSQLPVKKSVFDSVDVLTKSISHAIALPLGDDLGASERLDARDNLFYQMGYLHAKLGPVSSLLITDETLELHQGPDRDWDYGFVKTLPKGGDDEGRWLADVAQWLKDVGYFIENKTVKDIRENGLGLKFKRAKPGPK